MNLKLDIDFEKLNLDLYTRLRKSGTETAVNLVCNLLLEQFEFWLKQMQIEGSIYRFRVDSLRNPLWGVRYPKPLSDLVLMPAIDMGYIALTIYIPLEEKFDLLKPTNFGTAVPVEMKYQPLKKQQKAVIKFKGLEVKGLYLKPALDNILSRGCNCPTETLVPYISSVWDWALQFICRVCGKVFVCECFRKAFDIHYPQALNALSSYSDGSQVHHFLEVYKGAEFRAGICHICREIPSDLFYCHPMYGSKILVHYGPYIMRYSIENHISPKEAEDYIRGSLGVSQIVGKWISEVELLKIVRDLFPDEKVLYQSSPEWLGLQRFDIFIPNLGVAIEYQGRQHFEPVDFFGGQEAFLRLQERDKKKANLCARNNVTLVYFRYDELITPRTVKRRITKALEKRV